MSKIIVVGAGVIGLATCEKLLLEGHEVTLIDHNQPGSQASFGHAGLVADFANKPLSNADTLKALPAMLLAKDSGISLDPGYITGIQHFGINFLRSALPHRFSNNKKALGNILLRSLKAHQQFSERANLHNVIGQSGCLHLFKQQATSLPKIKATYQDKSAAGIKCELLSKQEVASIEPDLNIQDVDAGILYSNTEFITNPEKHSQQIFNHISRNPRFSYVAQKVLSFEDYNHCMQVQLSNGSLQADKLVLCAGIHNNALLRQQGVRVPIVSERGYHVSLNYDGIKLKRPVGWSGKYIFAIPMQGSIRVAGTTEFARIHKQEDKQRYEMMKSWGEQMFDREMGETDRWMGVRHSSPDGMPVISRLPKMKNVIACYGHGHLGLTMASFSADFIAREIAGNNEQQLSQSLSIQRFM